MAGVTAEQVRAAKSVGILDYLRSHEPGSLRKSKGNAGEYYLAEHDSLKISGGKFHWFSRGVGGYSALDFLVKVRGMGFVDAVRFLASDGKAYKNESLPPPKPAPPPKPFSLPPKNLSNDRAIAYLRGRGIDMDTIKRCIDGGILYESAKRNCVFVGYDGNTPRFACERGTTDGYKKDVPGSDKRFSFALPPKEANNRNLAVFEAPADALSHAALSKLNGDGWDGHRLSLGGVGALALMSFLERNPHIESVRLCLDNDSAGVRASGRIIKGLVGDKRFSHLKVTNAPPPEGLGKDYNDCLQSVIQRSRQKSKPSRPKEAASLI